MILIIFIYFIIFYIFNFLNTNNSTSAEAGGWILNNYPTDVNITNFVQIEVIGHSLYIFAAVLLIILSLILL